MNDRLQIPVAAIVCGHIAKGAAINLAMRTEPVDFGDSGWQFLCGLGNESTSESQVLAIDEVLKKEASLRPYINLPVGTVIRRSLLQNDWSVDS